MGNGKKEPAAGACVRGRTVVLATRNPGKLREMREILAGLPVDFALLADCPEVPEPEETGRTFVQNARLKAMYYARATGHLALADDSGLEVDALGGRPGIHSARFAGTDKDDAANNARLLHELAGVPEERRSARFRCAVCLAEPDRALLEAEGAIEGRIIDEPRGENGFGYDPHFLVPELGVTTAQLSSAQKSRISHRGRALRALAQKLQGAE